MPDDALAAGLEKLRLDAGLSLRALGKSSGIPRSTLSDALSGRRAPSLDTVLAIVRACGADPQPWRRRWADAKRRARPPAPAARPQVAGSSASSAVGTSNGQAGMAGTPASGAVAVAPVPAQLPFDTQGFTGRHQELDMLDATRLAVIHGGPGFGKTALAVRWAHQVAGRFPDGQLFLNLRGHHPTLGPTPPVEVLRRLLDSLGVTWATSTPDLDEGANLWRSSLAGKRLLIVLDDAVSADQVRPALPGAAGCALVVTSRRHLSELVVSDGADSIALGTLAEENSLAVLEQTIGQPRIAAEPKAARVLAAACGHLPLALRMAGAVLSASPEVSLTELANALSGGSQLTALETLASPSVVENAFELSYRALSDDARLLFRRLAVMPGPDLNADVAALLTDLPRADVGGTLRVLIDAHMIEPVGTGRYRMHDLLRDYAVRLAENTDTDAERDAAHRRLLDWYVDRALAISVLLGWSGWSRDLIWIDERSTSWQPTGNDASAWLDAEKRNIVAVIEHDAKHGNGRYAWTLVDLLADSLLRRNDVSELIVATDASLVAARRHRELRAEARLLLSRGWLRWRNAITDDVTDDFASAVSLFRRIDDPRGEISALRGLADCHIRAGRVDASKRCLAEALDIAHATDDNYSVATLHNSLAIVAVQTADFVAAQKLLSESVALHRTNGDKANVAVGLSNLAYTHIVRGELDDAIARAADAVELARQMGDSFAEALGLINGALAQHQAGAYEQARRWAIAARDQAGRMRHKWFEAMASYALATVVGRTNPVAGVKYRKQALELAIQSNDDSGISSVLVGVARDSYSAAARATNQQVRAFREARGHAETAYNAARQCNNPYEATQALAVLAACDTALGKVTDAISEARDAVDQHVVSGARLAEIRARCVLVKALARNNDRAAAEHELAIASSVVDSLNLPESAPVRRLLATATSQQPLSEA